MNTYTYFVSYSWSAQGMGGFGNMTISIRMTCDPMSSVAIEGLIREVGRTARTPYPNAGIVMLHFALLSD